MSNEVLIQTRITKKPLRIEGRFVEVVHIRLLLNGITLYETNSDIYTMICLVQVGIQSIVKFSFFNI